MSVSMYLGRLKIAGKTEVRREFQFLELIAINDVGNAFRARRRMEVYVIGINESVNIFVQFVSKSIAKRY